jgi:hypothetical protein
MPIATTFSVDATLERLQNRVALSEEELQSTKTSARAR